MTSELAVIHAVGDADRTPELCNGLIGQTNGHIARATAAAGAVRFFGLGGQEEVVRDSLLGAFVGRPA